MVGQLLSYTLFHTYEAQRLMKSTEEKKIGSANSSIPSQSLLRQN